MSINRLTQPNTQTPPGICRRVPTRDGPDAGLSAEAGRSSIYALHLAKNETPCPCHLIERDELSVALDELEGRARRGCHAKHAITRCNEALVTLSRHAQPQRAVVAHEHLDAQAGGRFVGSRKTLQQGGRMSKLLAYEHHFVLDDLRDEAVDIAVVRRLKVDAPARVVFGIVCFGVEAVVVVVLQRQILIAKLQAQMAVL